MRVFQRRQRQDETGHGNAGQTVLPLLMVSIVAVVSFILYWQTCFRNITWWNSAEYSLAACTLGICAPPGSLLLTLIGWVVTRLPLANSQAFLLNLLAGALAAMTAALVTLIALRMIDRNAPPGWSAVWPRISVATAGGAVLGSLVFAFAETLWLHAVKLTPYILTTLFTAMIFWVMFRWWEKADRPGSLRWLFLLALLFGLDFSVHRTNAVLLPGLFFWILIRRPKTLVSVKAWLSGLAGLATGLSVQLVLIPMASRAPFLNMNNPDSWTRFWDYVSIKMAGGGFLVSFFPRKAAFFSEQVGDWLNAFSVNFLHYDSSLGLLGFVPGLLGLIGLVLLWRKDARLGIAFTTFFVLAVATTIMYFNIPSGFFRSLHRHYLPTLLLFAVLVAYGAGALVMGVGMLLKKYRMPAIALLVMLLAVIAFSQVDRNYRAVDGSRDHCAAGFARDLLEMLPANAILFTAGDNDTFPLWYLREVEHIRPDVEILNLPLMNTRWFIQQLLERDTAFPLTLADEDMSNLGPRPWKDTSLVIPVEGNPDFFALPESGRLPDSIILHVTPTIAGSHLLPQDWLLLDIVRQNEWQRPIYFSTGVDPGRLPGLAPYLRLEGYAWRLVPTAPVVLNREILRANLLERYDYSSFVDPDVPLELPTRWRVWGLYQAFGTLAAAEVQAAGDSACLEVQSRMYALLPPERFEPTAEMRQKLAGICAAADARGQ